LRASAAKAILPVRPGFERPVPFGKSKKVGRSKYGILFEETYHAWEYETGSLNLLSPTVYNEARAWKFASTAPNTVLRLKDVYKGKTYNDYTVMYSMLNKTIPDIADLFKNGWKASYDKIGNGYLFINKTNSPLVGLYSHLKLK